MKKTALVAALITCVALLLALGFWGDPFPKDESQTPWHRDSQARPQAESPPIDNALETIAPADSLPAATLDSPGDGGEALAAEEGGTGVDPTSGGLSDAQLRDLKLHNYEGYLRHQKSLRRGADSLSKNERKEQARGRTAEKVLKYLRDKNTAQGGSKSE